jgi:predicted AAA+ superfamily ATPase
MFDANGKRMLEYSGKYYMVDTGLRNSQCRFDISNLGAIYENIVFLELQRRGYVVSVGKLRNGKEIDFVATKDKELIYIQVAVTLENDKIKEREYGNLKSIRDSFKKIIIIGDEIDSIDSSTGIEVINIANWLLDERV